MTWVILVLLALLAPGCFSKSAMFEYGTGFGDTIIVHPDDQLVVEFRHSVPFFGRKYKHAYISWDGLLGFSTEAHYRPIHYHDGPDDPSNDFPFLAAFHYHSAKPRNTRTYQGNVFYRRMTDYIHLSDYARYVRNAIVGVPNSFQPEVALQVTWENVTDAIILDDEKCVAEKESLNPCPSATFQILFVASRHHSFAFMNYGKMAIPLHSYYQAGFNGGDGLGWKSVLPCVAPSCNVNINDLPTLQGSDVIGRFIFDVGAQQIRRGGCVPIELPGEDLLEFVPRYASLLGGEMLNISGTCIPAHASVACRFGSDPAHQVITQGIVVNVMQARCPVPRLTQRGDTEISFSVGGNNFKHKSSITIVQMGRIPLTLNVEQDGPSRRWNETDAEELRVTWLPSRISHRHDVLLDIKLIGYRETQTEVRWKKLKTLGYGVPNTGTFSFTPSEHRCGGEDCDMFEVGVIEATLRPEHWEHSNTDVAVSYGITPLGWFVTKAMTSRYGDRWVVDKCMEWYKDDRADMSWLGELLHCPCTLEQAIADFGRWQSDVSCNIYSASKTNCDYHIGAIHCIRSFLPTKDGSGNQCCYGPDKMLKYAADSYQGSTPDRSHDNGAEPYNRPGRVPAASHWVKDVISFYYCCLWTNYDHCDYYMDQRPTRDCVGYKPPTAGIAYGDPHLRTFDGKKYHFGGKGDFWLYKSEHIKIQGRFEIRQQTQNFSNVNATVLTGVAMAGTSGQIVEIRLAPPNLVSENRLQLLVDGRRKYFDHNPLRMQNYKGVSVITNEPEGDLHLQGNFTVLFSCGVGVLVAENSRLLHVTTNLPPEFKDLETFSGGLLGTWNNDVNDDFTSADGSRVSVTTSPEQRFRRFGLSWAVHENESLFQKPLTADRLFVPTFTAPPIPPGSSLSESDVRRLCDDNTQCRFDYVVTGDAQVATATLTTLHWFDALRYSQQPAEVCGLLDVPRSIKNNHNYSLGSTVVVVGCRNGGAVEGEATHTCVYDEGNLVWSPSAKAYCTAHGGARVAVIAGIVVGVVVALAIIFIIAIVSYKRRHKYKDEISSGKSKRGTKIEEADAMMSDLEKRAADNV